MGAVLLVREAVLLVIEAAHLLADLEVALAGLADKELVLQDHVQGQLLDPCTHSHQKLVRDRARNSHRKDARCSMLDARSREKHRRKHVSDHEG
eukprot:195777-Rhodomonas_salina.1